MIWAVLIATTVGYLGYAEYLGRQGSFPAEAPATALTASLAAVAVALAIASFVLPRVIRANALARRGVAMTREVTSDAGAGSFRDAASSRAAYADPAAARAAVAATFQQPFIIGMALAEAISLLGLCFAFMGGSRTTAFGFWALSWVAMIARFPTRAALLRAASRAYGAPLG